MPELDENWRVPSDSGSSGSCFEARAISRDGATVIQVRNSNRPDAAVVEFDVEEWRKAKGAFGRGEFDPREFNV